jgi:hypothetical protein
MFENRVLGKVFGHEREEVIAGENYMIRTFVICTPHHIFG